jgi:hypothetical protein
MGQLRSGACKNRAFRSNGLPHGCRGRFRGMDRSKGAEIPTNMGIFAVYLVPSRPTNYWFKIDSCQTKLGIN